MPKRQERTRPASEPGRTPPADLQPEVPPGARPPSCALALRPPRCRSCRLTSGNAWPEAPTTKALRPSGKASLLGPGRQAASQSHCHSLATRWRKCAVQPLSLSSERPVSPSAHDEAPSYSHHGPGGLWCPELHPPGAGGRCRSCPRLRLPWREPPWAWGCRTVHMAVWPTACMRGSARPPPAECVPGPRLPAAGRGGDAHGSWLSTVTSNQLHRRPTSASDLQPPVKPAHGTPRCLPPEGSRVPLRHVLGAPGGVSPILAGPARMARAPASPPPSPWLQATGTLASSGRPCPSLQQKCLLLSPLCPLCPSTLSHKGT